MAKQQLIMDHLPYRTSKLSHREKIHYVTHFMGSFRIKRGNPCGQTTTLSLWPSINDCCQILKKLGMETFFNEKLWGQREFRENRVNDGHILLEGVTVFPPLSFHFLHRSGCNLV
jgi:hypothetical protein